MQSPDKVSLQTTGRDRRRIHEWVTRSVLITLITWFSGPTPLAAQNTGNVASNPALVYVSNGGGGITEVNTVNDSVIATAPFPNNANGVVVTPDGRRMYASNRDVGQVTVLDTSTNVPLAVIPVGNAGDNLGVAISPDGRLVYVANQLSGTVTAIYAPTNTVIQTIPTGVEPIWITFSADGSRAYVSNQVSGTVSVVATASGTVVANISGFACPFQSKLTSDGSKLLVSSQCDNSLKVVNLATNTVVNSIFAGPSPRGIALTPDGTKAYVADFTANTLQVIDVGAQANLNTPITVGANPWGIAMAPDGKAYVANFGDNTISVIDTSTNTVTATLHSRANPEDVTVSTTARPAILNYTFHPLDVPGSIRTNPQAINNAGQIVGSYDSSDAVRHGFLRQENGVFVTIDPVGSTLTVAIGISDLGVIAGEWADASGRFHGFTRSPGGTFSTVDFPDAVDTVLTGINDYGTIVGGYDLGDQTTDISFVFRQGVFTSFEDPAAAPMQTLGNGINDGGVISGFYMDAAGNTHGFARGVGGTFQNYDFPGSDFTDAARINNRGQIVGGTLTIFPLRGYIVTLTDVISGQVPASQFLSFDYPDSRNSSLHGINDQGQVVGFYRVFGSDTLHGFVATPSTNAQGNQNNQ
jgi:YVTN family beta-propeller protein